jgi:hypothetical protein
LMMVKSKDDVVRAQWYGPQLWSAKELVARPAVASTTRVLDKIYLRFMQSSLFLIEFPETRLL